MNQLRVIRAFSAVVLRQLGRDRTALFFMVALPVAIMVIIGATFGGQGRLDIGLVAPDEGVVSERVEAALELAPGLRVHRYGDLDALRRAIRRATVAGGVVVDADAENAWRRDGRVAVGVAVPLTSESAVTVRRVVTGVLDDVATTLGAARFASVQAAAPIEEALSVADAVRLDDAGPRVAVEVLDIGPRRAVLDNRFSQTAPQNLVLFTFITALTSATLLVRARRTGILRRAQATPAGMVTLLGGMAAGWFLLCLLQSLLIVAVGVVAFGVRWGEPFAAAALVVTFAGVGCGAGLLVGALGANEDRVGAVTPVIGIVTGALGGCMVPLEVFPSAMVSLARFTPHYWAVDAWETLIFDDGALADIAANLAVLAAVAVALVMAAGLTMRRALGAGR